MRLGFICKRTRIVLIIEIEYCLRLHEHLTSEQPCGEVWTLLTGYSFLGVNDTPEKRHICLIARHRVRHLRTATSWSQWLSWYADQRADLRLYDVDLQIGSCQQRMPLTFMPERIDSYDAAIELVPRHRQRSANWAQAKDYVFSIRGETYSVRIPAYLSLLNAPSTVQELPSSKDFVRREQDTANHSHFYDQYILDFFVREKQAASDSLAATLKTPAERITKSSLKKDLSIPSRKTFVSRFIQEHPDIIEQ